MTTEANTDGPRQAFAPDAPVDEKPKSSRSGASPAAAIVATIIAAIVGLSGWYRVQPRPLLVQGEADSTRIDMAARVDGRVGEIPVVRGENVAAAAPLVRIENPELLAKLEEARASKAVAQAELARINAGTRQEIVAVRKAEIDRAEANLTLAHQTYDRTAEAALANFQSADVARAKAILFHQQSRPIQDAFMIGVNEVVSGAKPASVAMTAVAEKANAVIRG